MVSKISLSAIAIQLLLVLSHFSSVEANSLFVPIKVVDCDGTTPLPGKTVALWGCVDNQVAKDSSVADMPLEGVVTNTGDDGFVQPGSTNGEVTPSECVNSYQTEFDYGSAQSTCNVAVLTPDGDVDDSYTSFVNSTALFAPNLHDWAHSNIGVCAQGFDNCSYARVCYNDSAQILKPDTVVLKRKQCGCPKATGCPGAAANYTCVPGASAYGYFCPTHSACGNTKYPTSFSLSGSQRRGVSKPVYGCRNHQWGWMVRWPTTYTCPLTGNLFADQDKAVGDITAQVAFDTTTNSYKLAYNYTMKGAGCGLSQVKVYFSCSQMSYQSPSQFTSSPTCSSTGSATISGTATASGCSCSAPCDGKYLYVTFYAVLSGGSTTTTTTSTYNYNYWGWSWGRKMI